MNLKPYLWLLLAAFALSSPAHADDDDTMIVVEEGATPEDIVNVIELPVFASPKATKNAAFGHETAKQANALGNEFGKQMAEEAKNKNISEQIRDDIQQNARREARGNNGQGNGQGG